MSLRFKHVNTSFILSTSKINDNSLKRRIDEIIRVVFKGFEENNDLELGFSFEFTDHLESYFSDDYYHQIDNIKVNNSQLYFNDAELNLVVNYKESIEVIIEIKDDNNLIPKFRFYNKSYKNNLELQITTFYYRVFLLFSQLWNIKNNFSYIHASSITDSNKDAILFTADSGVGKSSLLFRIAKENKYSFIADDLAIIDNDSNVYYQGRSLSVKPYHLKYFPFLKKVIYDNMSIGQRLQWLFLNDNRLTSRIDSSLLFNSKCDSANLDKIIHLCNHSKSEFMIKKISSDNLLNMTIPILNNEFFLSFSKLDKIASLPNNSFLSSIMLLNKASKIFKDTFKYTDKFLVSVPFRSNPNDLYKFLVKKKCLS